MDMMFPRPAEKCVMVFEMVYRRCVIEDSAVVNLSQVMIGSISWEYFDVCVVGMLVLFVVSVSWVGRISDKSLVVATLGAKKVLWYDNAIAPPVSNITIASQWERAWIERVWV
jgi:hypothetical protein